MKADVVKKIDLESTKALAAHKHIVKPEEVDGEDINDNKSGVKRKRKRKAGKDMFNESVCGKRNFICDSAPWLRFISIKRDFQWHTVANAKDLTKTMRGMVDVQVQTANQTEERAKRAKTREFIQQLHSDTMKFLASEDPDMRARGHQLWARYDAGMAKMGEKYGFWVVSCMYLRITRTPSTFIISTTQGTSRLLASAKGHGRLLRATCICLQIL